MPNTTMGSAPVATLARIQTCLRESTRPSHRAIDHHPLLAPLVQPTLSLAHYQHVLTVMNWMHRALRERLTEAMAEYLPGSAFLPSDRTGWLAGDLEWFGMPNTCAPERIVDCLTLRFMSPHSLVGALYVLEGSTLGGQVITRQLAQSIQVYQAREPASFMAMVRTQLCVGMLSGRPLQTFAHKARWMRCALQQFTCLKTWSVCSIPAIQAA
jgi:heme oxygenase